MCTRIGSESHPRARSAYLQTKSVVAPASSSPVSHASCAPGDGGKQGAWDAKTLLSFSRRSGARDEYESGKDRRQASRAYNDKTRVEQWLHTHVGAGDKPLVDAPRAAHALPTRMSRWSRCTRDSAMC